MQEHIQVEVEVILEMLFLLLRKEKFWEMEKQVKEEYVSMELCRVITGLKMQKGFLMIV